MARFASTGDIVRLDFRPEVGGLEKVNKEDARKIWEISGGIRVNCGDIKPFNSHIMRAKNPASILYFGRLGEGVWNLETGYQRRQEPQEDFDPEVNWQRLVTFAEWERDGEP